MIRIKKLLAFAFLLGWVAGETPRLFWKEFLPIRPMDVVAALLMVTEWRNLVENKIWRWATAILLGSWVLGLRLFSLAEATDGLFYLIRTIVYLGLIVNGGRLFVPVKKWILAAMAGFVGLGFLQYIFLSDMRFLLQYGWDEHYYRLVGTVLDPNYFGVMAGMIVFWAIKNYKDYKSYNLGIAAAAFVALILTWSRASWVAFGAAAGWWGILGVSGKSGRSGRLGILGILGILGLGVWWAAPKPGGEGVNLWRTASIQQRLVSWNQAVGVWREHSWLGVGFNNYGVGSRKYGVGDADYSRNSPSSSWLLLLSTLGVVGMSGMVIGGIGVIGEIRNRKFWLGIIIMVSIHAIFNNTLFYPPVLGLLALLRIRSLR